MFPTLLSGSEDTSDPHANSTDAVIADKLAGGGYCRECQRGLYDKTRRIGGRQKSRRRDRAALPIITQDDRWHCIRGFGQPVEGVSYLRRQAIRGELTHHRV